MVPLGDGCSKSAVEFAPLELGALWLVVEASKLIVKASRKAMVLGVPD